MFSLLHGSDDSGGPGVYSSLPGTLGDERDGGNVSGHLDDDVELNEIERDSLTFVEKIGEGLFGEVGWLARKKLFCGFVLTFWVIL